MELAQWFETTIEDGDLPADVGGFRFVFIPSLGRHEEHGLPVDEIADEFELEYLAALSSAASLPSVLAALLTEGDAASAVETPWRAGDTNGGEIAMFVENVAYSRVIPVRTNPLDLQSLASVLATGSGTMAGAWAGVVASGGSPLILITVPVGMILGGGAAAVGRALEEGLHERLRAWIRRPAPPMLRGVHTREIRLAGNGQNDAFLRALLSIPGVERQTRFIVEVEPGISRIRMWSADEVPEADLVRIAEATGAQIVSVSSDDMQ